MAHRIESDLDFGGASRITNLPAPAADNDAARRMDLVFSQVVVIADVKAYNEDGGAFTAGARRTRDLNTILSGGSYASITSNKVTLDAGIWEVCWQAPAHFVTSHWSFLRNVTAETDVGKGSAAYSHNSGSFIVTLSVGAAVFVANGTDEIAIEHQCVVTAAANGFGVRTTVSGNDSVYSMMVCRRIA